MAEGRIPVVGILAQPRHLTSTNDDKQQQKQQYGGRRSSSPHYIAASYVKWVEAGGAMAIAVPYNATDETVYDDVLQRIDGLLLPGGAAPLSQGVVTLLDKIRTLSTTTTQGDRRYFPVFGTCLGFEFLVQYQSTHRQPLESGFQASNVSWALEQVVPREMYQDAAMYQAVTEHNITFHYHLQGIRPETFAADAQLTQMWQITAMNHDQRGVPFVSSIEPMDPETLPWYGVQYHPEKNAFEYGIYKNDDKDYNNNMIPYQVIDHSATGVYFSTTLAQWWVAKVRRAAEARNPAIDTASSTTTAMFAWPPVTTFPVQAGRAFEQIFVLPAQYPYDTTKTTTHKSTFSSSLSLSTHVGAMTRPQQQQQQQPKEAHADLGHSWL